MSEKVSAKSIGTFTILAITLLVAGIMVFGSGDLFKKEYYVEMVFPGDVKGLSVGSSITYRGVRIGEVTVIDFSFDENTDELFIIVEGKILEREREINNLKTMDDFFETQIERGLRAQLVAESMVTGRLQVQLEYFPDRQMFQRDSYLGHSVIPTVATDFEQLAESLKKLGTGLQNLPLEEISKNIEELTAGVNNIVNSKDISDSISNFSSSLMHLNNILAAIDANKEDMSKDLSETTKAIRDMANSVGEASDSSQALITSAQHSIGELDTLLITANGTLKTYEALAQPGSEMSVSLIKTMQAIEQASLQIKQLAETLQRNPESILRGKQR